MENSFEDRIENLKKEINKIVNNVEMTKSNKSKLTFNPQISKNLSEKFLKIVDKVCTGLISHKDNFYGYFLFQMERQISFNISSATAVNFKNAKYYIYFNPIIFLELSLKQMQSSIKHEIYHLLSFHMIRARGLKDKYSSLAINLAMDVVVNQYLDNLPYYSITLNYINNKYNLDLKPYNSFEYYVDNIQKELKQLEEDEKGEIVDVIGDNEEKAHNYVESEFEVQKSHEIWNQSNNIDDKTLMDFTQKYISGAQKGIMPDLVKNMVYASKSIRGELPWNLYLKKIMGTVTANKKKINTRRNRRQSERLDLRGELRSYKAKIVVALDVSGSISNEEFKQAIREVLSIVRNYNHEITIIECDREIRRTYTVRSIKEVKNREAYGGGTKFSPVFEYANSKRIDFLIYFTDGKGEQKLEVIPKNYKVLWVISGRGEELSLEEPYGVVKKLKQVSVKEDIDLKDIKTDGYSMNNQEPIF